MADHRAAGAVTGGAESEGLRLRGPREDVGSGAHGATDQDRLPCGTQRLRNVGMTRPERACRALAMHVERTGAVVTAMLFDLARVVRYVVEQRQMRARQDPGKRLAHNAREDLAM